MKIKHVVVIMQENRSFDHYFGTYPGAEGIPMQDGVPTVCLPDPKTEECVKPFHDPNDKNHGGPHGVRAAITDIHGGKMDGFVKKAKQAKKNCTDVNDPTCASASNQQEADVMGYHDAREIPNYWAYAENFVLQDHMFEPNASWSLPSALFKVSGWSARCTEQDQPSSCTSELTDPGAPPDFQAEERAAKGESLALPRYAWTDLTYLLHENDVSWGYYVVAGTEPDCEDNDSIPEASAVLAAVSVLVWRLGGRLFLALDARAKPSSICCLAALERPG